MLFEEAIVQVKTLKQRPDNETLLKLYSLYKQSTVGDCNTTKPYFYQFEELAKWNAWNNQKGKSKDLAKKHYINLVEKLVKNNK
jgi:diazepam-binding inhibitor (GABA receptor modulating acyl-CoA-binding protein)